MRGMKGTAEDVDYTPGHVSRNSTGFEVFHDMLAAP